MIELAACLACAAGFHDECQDPHLNEDGETYTCCCAHDEAKPASEASGGNALAGEVGRPLKDLDQIVDKVSAGRKRAASIAPIFPGMICEWAGLRNAGGGVQPIVGCLGNRVAEKGNGGFMQGDRHHGPNKSTLDNTPGVNLHRICAECHAHWHALNDPAYGRKRPPADEPWWPSEDAECYAHDPNTEATDEEILANEDYWATRTELRGPYPIPLDPDLRIINR